MNPSEAPIKNSELLVPTQIIWFNSSKIGQEVIFLTSTSGDSGGVKTSEGVYNNVTAGLKKDRSNVVLMHDFSGNQKTVDALPGIIDFAKNEGYTFDRITDTIKLYICIHFFRRII